jgi:hypothetical protein
MIGKEVQLLVKLMYNQWKFIGIYVYMNVYTGITKNLN